MYVGIVDQNFLLYPNSFIPSLELMKCASYYKKRGDIVKMVYDINNISQFDIILLITCNPSSSNFPKLLISNPKVQWIGAKDNCDSLSYNKLPDEIENCLSDKTIYKSFFEKNINNFTKKQKEKLSSFFKNGNAYRLSHNGKIIFDFDKIEKNSDKIYIYDKNIFFSKDFFNQVEKYNLSNRLVFLETQFTNNFEDFKAAKKIIPFARAWGDKVVFAYTGPINKKTFLQNFDLFANGYYLSLENYNNQQSLPNFLMQEIIKKGNFFFYSIAKGKKIKIVDNYELNGCNLDEYRVLKYFCRFTKVSGKASDINFYTALKKDRPVIYQLAKKVGKRNSKANRIFQANIKTISELGVWVL